MVEALERLMGRHHALLREAAKQASSRYLPEQALEAGGVADRLLTDRRPQSRKAQLEKQKNREIRLLRYEAVKRMRREGMSISAIGRSLGMSRETVRMFLRADTFPERAPAYRRVGQIKLYADYLKKRWCEGQIRVGC